MGRFINVVCAFGAWVLLLMLFSYTSERWHQHAQSKCFQFEDRQERYACLRSR